MKNQYFGDVGDYGKYAMLRFLADDGIKIAVNWYLTADDGSNDGKFTSYLAKEEMRQYDPELFDALNMLVSAGNRGIDAFEKLNLIKDATYYSRILCDDKNMRDNWHAEGVVACAGADLVFLDPDNGAAARKTGKNSCKYCFSDEIADYFNTGQNVVYYCQKARRTHEQWGKAKCLMKEKLPDCKLLAITFHKGTQRTYIFVLHEADFERYENLLKEFCEKWKTVFTEETCGN